MTNEGEFPKADGDILYASEANRFANTGLTITKNDFIAVGSAAINNGPVCGSIVIPAGSLANITTLNIQGTTDLGNTGVGRIQLSGTNFGNTITNGIDLFNGGHRKYLYQSFLASGNSSWIIQYSIPWSDNNVSNESVFNSYPNSGLVILFKIEHSGTSHNWINAIVETRSVY
ncbi:hypothetical protein KAI04_03840 [Candidatus Pacearchaeota archaeon]|nr:hypothetical protein [Candidatus Pacearchaeota archaeon]